MAKCAFCSKTIVFGGRRVGEQVFCNARCMIHGRQLLQIDEEAGVADLRGAVRDFRDALLVLAEEVEEQRTSLSEATERLDFAERTLAQLRATVGQTRPPAK